MSTMSDLGDVQRPRHPLGHRLLHRPAAHQRRRRERQPRISPPHRDQAGLAFLHDGVRIGRDPAGLQPGVTGAQRGMSGERQLPRGREDPDQVVGPAGPGRQHERGLRQVRPAREQLHLLAGEPVGAEHDRDRVAGVRGIGEDVDLTELTSHTPSVEGHAARRQCQIPRPIFGSPRVQAVGRGTGRGLAYGIVCSQAPDLAPNCT